MKNIEVRKYTKASLIVLNLTILVIMMSLGLEEYQQNTEILSDYSVVDARHEFVEVTNGADLEFYQYSYHFDINGEIYRGTYKKVFLFKNIKNKNRVNQNKTIKIAYSNKNYSKFKVLDFLLQRNKNYYIKTILLSIIGMFLISTLLYFILIKIIFRLK